MSAFEVQGRSHVHKRSGEEHNAIFRFHDSDISLHISLSNAAPPLPPCDCVETIWVGKPCPENYDEKVKTVLPHEELPQALTDLTNGRRSATHGMYQIGDSPGYIVQPSSMYSLRGLPLALNKGATATKAKSRTSHGGRVAAKKVATANTSKKKSPPPRGKNKTKSGNKATTTEKPTVEVKKGKILLIKSTKNNTKAQVEFSDLIGPSSETPIYLFFCTDY